jgi:stage II sporulation protein AA (anti-sigma F factor antagonist)
VRKPLGEVVILTFFPGPTITLDSIERVNLVTSAAGDLSRVVINLSHLQVIPTVFLGMLVALHHRAAKIGGKLKLCGLRPELLPTLKVAILNHMFDIHDDEQSALASFGILSQPASAVAPVQSSELCPRTLDQDVPTSMGTCPALLGP